MSDNSISCTIVNRTSGTLVLSGSDANTATELTIGSGANAIASGASVHAFTGSNNRMSGCGGTVKYTLPNNSSVLVIAYNTSTNHDNSYCTPMLQSTSPNEAGVDAYYCQTVNAAVSGTSDGVTATITVYEVG
jgi:hypothetical protein